MSFFLSPLGNEIDPFFGSPPEMHPAHQMQSLTQMHPMTQMHPLNQMNMVNRNNSMVYQSGLSDFLQLLGFLPPPPPPPPVSFPAFELNFRVGMLPEVSGHSFSSSTTLRLSNGPDGHPQGIPDGNGHSFSSSTMVRLSSGPDGRPQVYHASSSTRTAPGGVREVKKAVCDTSSGVKKMAIGHHIGDRGHVMERQQNLISGEQEINQEYINISEDEAEDFNKEFEGKIKKSIGNASGALTNVVEGHGNTGRRNLRRALLPSSSVSEANTSGEGRPRKRQHEPDPEVEEVELGVEFRGRKAFVKEGGIIKL